MGTIAFVILVPVVGAGCVLSLGGILQFHNGAHRAVVTIDKVQLAEWITRLRASLQHWAGTGLSCMGQLVDRTRRRT